MNGDKARCVCGHKMQAHVPHKHRWRCFECECDDYVTSIRYPATGGE